MLRERSGGVQSVRDWKMALTGAGVAALLILFVLGVFTGRGPATGEIQAAQKVLQTSTTARPAAVSVGPTSTTSASTNRVINTKTNSDAPVKSDQAPGSPAGSPGRVQQATPRQHRIHQGQRDAADSEQEVTVRYFNHTHHHAAKVVAGVRHYSDLD
jgi:hypothetical protein